MVVILYVDELIILASDVAKLTMFKSKLEKQFEMSDLGELHYLPRVKFVKNREAHTIIMNQRRYIEKVLNHFNMK